MKIVRTAITALPVLAGVGLSLGLAAPAGASTPGAASGGPVANTPIVSVPMQPARPHDARAVAINCEREKVVRPQDFELSCGDGSFGLVGLSWNRWELNHAHGYGTEVINDCQPDCGQGHWHSYAVNVAFWGSAGVYGHPGERRYTGYTLTYTANRPPDQQTDTYTGSLWG